MGVSKVNSSPISNLSQRRVWTSKRRWHRPSGQTSSVPGPERGRRVCIQRTAVRRLHPPACGCSGRFASQRRTNGLYCVLSYLPPDSWESCRFFRAVAAHPPRKAFLAVRRTACHTAGTSTADPDLSVKTRLHHLDSAVLTGDFGLAFFGQKRQNDSGSPNPTFGASPRLFVRLAGFEPSDLKLSRQVL